MVNCIVVIMLISPWLTNNDCNQKIVILGLYYYGSDYNVVNEQLIICGLTCCGNVPNQKLVNLFCCGNVDQRLYCQKNTPIWIWVSWGQNYYGNDCIMCNEKLKNCRLYCYGNMFDLKLVNLSCCDNVDHRLDCYGHVCNQKLVKLELYYLSNDCNIANKKLTNYGLYCYGNICICNHYVKNFGLICHINVCNHELRTLELYHYCNDSNLEIYSGLTCHSNVCNQKRTKPYCGNDSLRLSSHVNDCTQNQGLSYRDSVSEMVNEKQIKLYRPWPTYGKVCNQKVVHSGLYSSSKVVIGLYCDGTNCNLKLAYLSHCCDNIDLGLCHQDNACNHKLVNPRLRYYGKVCNVVNKKLIGHELYYYGHNQKGVNIGLFYWGNYGYLICISMVYFYVTTYTSSLTLLGVPKLLWYVFLIEKVGPKNGYQRISMHTIVPVCFNHD